MFYYGQSILFFFWTLFQRFLRKTNPYIGGCDCWYNCEFYTRANEFFNTLARVYGSLLKVILRTDFVLKLLRALGSVQNVPFGRPKASLGTFTHQGF